MIRATWCNSGNVGDRLTPWLIKRMTGQQPVYIDHRDPFLKYLACGSVLEWADENAIVWGSGILSTEAPVNPLADIRAVRGPRSRERAMECGAPCPEVFGDPGLLCPRFFPSEHEPKYAVGVIAHYTDQYLHIPRDGWQYISVFDDVETFIDRITQCEVILGIFGDCGQIRVFGSIIPTDCSVLAETQLSCCGGSNSNRQSFWHVPSVIGTSFLHEGHNKTGGITNGGVDRGHSKRPNCSRTMI